MKWKMSIFYERYNSNHHQMKAIMLKSVLDEIDKYQNEFFSNELDKAQSDQFKQTVKLELRYNYLHAIETVFELFFALNPHKRKSLGDFNILLSLVTSNFKRNYDRISNIAENESALDFLHETITLHGKKYTIGHYLLYPGIYKDIGPGEEMHNWLLESIEGFKLALQILARDFSNRQQYNSMKHGMRLFPLFDKVKFESPYFKTSMIECISYLSADQRNNKMFMNFVSLDSERDFEMTILCSNIINMLFTYRKIFLRITKFEPDEEIPIRFFDREEIMKISKHNSPVYRFTQSYDFDFKER